ncbi:MAG: hypothetical protein M4579_005285, partial [Chaenotheca gracillima]
MMLSLTGPPPCLALCFLLNLVLIKAIPLDIRPTPPPELEMLNRRQAGPDTTWMTGGYTGTMLSIPGLTADSVTITTITQSTLTTTTTLPVYFCSPAETASCTATISGKPTVFNAEVRWPADIAAQKGFMYPPDWATQVLSVGCDGTAYQINHVTTPQGPKSCPTANGGGGAGTVGPSTGDVVTIGGQVYTAQPSGSVVAIGTFTVTQNSPAMTIGGIAVSYGPSSVLNVGTSQIVVTAAPDGQSTPTPGIITIGSQPFTPAPSGSVVVIGSQTVTAGSPPATIDATPVSLGPNGVLVFGGNTITLPTAAANPGTTKPVTTNPGAANP